VKFSDAGRVILFFIGCFIAEVIVQKKQGVVAQLAECPFLVP
jgi:hypothetical protein